ncbi:HD domain-containing phosphohydrolase [uncultured Desulfobulbus sp.]|uniref:HD-GYP domain-containing protein n=1 Tax=uncultured Desulfobulbus sp. TaxID=239745 RepID=UPI0029C636BA|nr:HD domain-containing phosphohydrolase [uncultured Desulfobulbus sp.]
MAKHRSLSLQTFVYRTLTIRLALMGSVIGLLTAGVAYTVERQNLSALVVEETRTEIQLLISRTDGIIKESGAEKRFAFRQALDERIDVRLERASGTYVYICFYTPGNPDIEERRDAGYDLADEVARFVGSQPRSTQDIGETAEIVTLGNRMHVYVVMPLLDQRQQKIGYAQAIFAPSDAARTGMQNKLRHTVLLTVLIVLATSGLLYPVILHLVGKLALFSRNLLDANLETLSLLASAIAKRDSDTDVHNFRVTLYAVRLAEAMHLANDEIQSLIKGAFLHDVGKIGIRDNILLKAGGLDEEEFSLMKEHVRHGMDIIRDSAWLSDGALVVEGHHEKFDGSGYPRGLAGEAIPLLARIFAVGDVFDALTSRRPYKEPLSYEAAMSILHQGRGTHFDPKIVDAFAFIAPELYRSCAGRDDQGLRDELKTVIAHYFSKGEILLY